MSHSETWFEVDGPIRLFVNRWLPPEPKAHLVWIHGIIEHGGRYAETAQLLAERGYAVWVPDLRGHGRSEGDRAWVSHFDQFADDLERFVAHVRDQASDAPCFVLGHSMGGAIVARWACTRDVRAQGVILSAPAIQVGGSVFPLLRRVARLASRIFPRLRLVRLGPSRLSSDPAVVADFRADPLVFHGRITTRIGGELLVTADWLQKSAADLACPLLLLHGTGDHVTDPEGSEAFFEDVRSEDKTLKLYDGLYHDLFHEPEKGQVASDLLEWLDTRVPPKSTSAG